MSVTVADVKSHLNITSDDEDALLEQKIAAASAWVEKFVGKPLAEFDPVPEPLNEAIRQLVGSLYENREATVVGISADLMPLGLYDLMAPYREYVF